MRRSSLFLTALATALLAACGTPEPGAGVGGAIVTDPYAAGPYAVSNTAFAQGEHGAPREGRLFVPHSDTVPGGGNGPFPVIQFSHGFTGSVDSYQQLLTHLASHGFVVIAPQLTPTYAEGGNPGNAPSIDEEVQRAYEFSQWVKGSLASTLEVAIDTGRYGLAGHSRGGQIVWRLLLGHPGLAQAIAGVDPVDGNAPPFSSDPGPLVTATPFNQGIPSYTLGTGLGATGGDAACAPTVRNYQHFYDASSSPAWVTVATDYGHVDMEDVTDPPACATNPQRDGMIAYTAGQLVAYFSYALKGAATTGFLEDFSTAPIAVTGEHK